MAMDVQDYGYGEQLAPPSPRAQRLPLEGRHCGANFTFVYLPTRWLFDVSVGGWLPDLVAVPHKPGVNGARAVKTGEDDAGRVQWQIEMGEVFAAFRAKKKATIIENFDERIVPQAPHSYVAVHRTHEGRAHHDAIWVRYEALGKLIDRTDDVARRTAFLQAVMRTYALRMPLLVLKQQVSILDDLLTRWGNDEKGSADVLGQKIRAGLKRRQAMIDAWTKQFGGGQTPSISAPPAGGYHASEPVEAPAPARAPAKPKAAKAAKAAPSDPPSRANAPKDPPPESP